MAAEFGNQPLQVIAVAGEEQEARETVIFSRESIFERETAADERAILRDALRRGTGEVIYKEIRAEFERPREGARFPVNPRVYPKLD